MQGGLPVREDRSAPEGPDLVAHNVADDFGARDHNERGAWNKTDQIN